MILAGRDVLLCFSQKLFEVMPLTAHMKKIQSTLADLETVTLLKTLINSNGYKEGCCAKDQVLDCVNSSSSLLFQVSSYISDSAITL